MQTKNTGVHQVVVEKRDVSMREGENVEWCVWDSSAAIEKSRVDHAERAREDFT
jgi:hypothetical protein